jgi:hypothetical protein
LRRVDDDDDDDDDDDKEGSGLLYSCAEDRMKMEILVFVGCLDLLSCE